MQEVIFHLQTITPLFMAGGEYSPIPIRPKRQQEKTGKRTFATHGWDLQTEIRSSSFRGFSGLFIHLLAGRLNLLLYPGILSLSICFLLPLIS